MIQNMFSAHTLFILVWTCYSHNRRYWCRPREWV